IKSASQVKSSHPCARTGAFPPGLKLPFTRTVANGLDGRPLIAAASTSIARRSALGISSTGRTVVVPKPTLRVYSLSSTQKLRLQEFSICHRGFGSRAKEAHRVVPALRDRQALGISPLQPPNWMTKPSAPFFAVIY